MTTPKPSYKSRVLLLAGNLGAAAIVAAQPAAYESLPQVTVEAMLPAYLARSAHHRLDADPNVNGYEAEFLIQSDQGEFRVRSVPMLALRVREIETVAQVSTQLARMLRDQDDRRTVERRGQVQTGNRSVVGLLDAPVSGTSGLGEQFSNTATSNIIGVQGNKVVTPDPQPKPLERAPSSLSSNDPIVQGHKRSAAAALGLDVYSTNPNVQALLDEVAIERASGNSQAGAISVSLPGGIDRRIADGRVDAAIRGALSRHPQPALQERNAGLLSNLGANDRLVGAFMGNAALSPRQRTEIVEYTVFLNDVGNRLALVAGAATAADEIEAERWTHAARALAHYHDRESRLARLIQSGHIPVGITQAGAMVVLLPFDVVLWDQATERVFKGVSSFASKQGIEVVEILTGGIATSAARNNLAAMGFNFRERYLFERTPHRMPSGRI
ncbi:MAG: hypothetical protein ACR2RL_09810 [Gammaproteobacteria bacterium]